MKKLLYLACVLIGFSACKKDDPDVGDETPSLNVSFKFNPTQERLDALGQPATIPAGNAALTPNMKQMSVHYMELLPTALTQYKGGEQVYMGAETNAGGANAIDFTNAIVAEQGVVFLEEELKNLSPGTYEYIRTSVSYQNGDFLYNLINIPSPSPVSELNNQTGTLVSFLGFNTYIENVVPNSAPVTIDDDKTQGFWIFETQLDLNFYNENIQVMGQAPQTTVVNPFGASNPIPLNSCVVTGVIDPPLVITGDETEDISLTLSYSINNSFEWTDNNNNGKFDVDASGQNTEVVVDMGLRGLKGIVD